MESAVDKGYTLDDAAQDSGALELLVTRRSRRSTAGNRMEAALAEMAAELQNAQDANADIEDDNDFEVVNDEQDVFGSDFTGTDEEEEGAIDAPRQGSQAGTAAATSQAEKSIEQEERRERHAARSRLEKATAAAHERNKATFNPESFTSRAAKSKDKGKAKQVLIELPDDGDDWDGWGPRKSQRTKTVLGRAATVQRLKAIEDRQQTRAPRKSKTTKKPPTQAELLSRALDNEEGNIIEHRDYLKNEEAKRKQVKVVKKKIRGQVVRVISRLEEVEVGPSGSHARSTASSSSPAHPHAFGEEDGPARPAALNMEKVAKTYVVHELGKGARKPFWSETMEALFGDDIDWEHAKAYGIDDPKRPISRPRYRCNITGKPAKYCDPQTGVRYMDKRGFDRARNALHGNYNWNPELCCFDGMDSEEEEEQQEQEQEGERASRSAEVDEDDGEGETSLFEGMSRLSEDSDEMYEERRDEDASQMRGQEDMQGVNQEDFMGTMDVYGQAGEGFVEGMEMGIGQDIEMAMNMEDMDMMADVGIPLGPLDSEMDMVMYGDQNAEIQRDVGGP
ncbi:YL1 nuclear protein-domain-containing protein [Coprinopsis sp. MPI-PUGE-AT-0042]|nr:YL1 nuclear protein-domain-containing protein [Coprinopsis sp. MPI-PUGE-AT-0042]